MATKHGRSRGVTEGPRSEREPPPGGGRSFAVGIWCTLALGIAFLVGMAAVFERGLDSRERSLYQDWVDNSAQAAQDGLQRILSHLQGLATLLSANPGLTREQFSEFTRPTLDLHLEHRAMRLIALEWLPKVTDEERRSIDAWGREHGVPDFRILERRGVLDLTARATRPVYFPILYQQPLEGRRSMIGFDYHSEPARVAAMRRAAASGRMAVSERIRLYRLEGDYGIVAVAPVYEVKSEPTEEDGPEWRGIAGFASAVIAASAIAEHMLAAVDLPSGAPQLRIYDLGDEAHETRIFPRDGAVDHPSADWVKKDVRVADRYFRVAAPVQLPFVHIETLIMVAVGLLLLLALLFRDWQRERLSRELRFAVAGLKAAEQDARTAKGYYQSLLETAPEAVFVLDAEEQTFVEVNGQALALAGLPRHELLGAHPRIISARMQPEGDDVDALVDRYMARTVAGENPVLEWVVERKDGKQIPCEVRLSLLSAADRRLVRASLIDITERKIIEQKQEWMLEQLRSLSQRMQREREQDRKEISGLIHDRIGQLITAVKISLGRVRKRLARDDRTDGELGARLAEIDDLTNELLDVSREIARDLRPALLDAGGFTEAIVEEVERWSDRTGVNAETSVGEVGYVPDPVALALFRSLQEFLTNVARHAGANRVMVWLKREEEQLILSVHDDGRGFDLADLERRRSFGLFLIRERASELGGQLGITSRPDTGTLVTLTLPLAQEQHGT
ncbi:CHASE domain-containing protein [Lentisalinibacter salinarum]|uniref:CHASE domain-containing protein n=1 Tax=Lentisalinibacter salinarum TaxID=2992239 RepID=UPI00386B0569